MVPYLRTTPANAITVLEGINVNGNLVIVKDYAGEAYLPQWGYNGIGNMQAGQGYQLKVNEPAVLQFLPNEQSD